MVVCRRFRRSVPYPEWLPTATSSLMPRSSIISTRVMAIVKRLKVWATCNLTLSDCPHKVPQRFCLVKSGATLSGLRRSQVAQRKPLTWLDRISLPQRPCAGALSLLGYALADLAQRERRPLDLLAHSRGARTAPDVPGLHRAAEVEHRLQILVEDGREGLILG